MNKIIITEHHKKLIKEYYEKLIKEALEIENIKLPVFISDSIKQHKTSLGKHDAFPPERDIRFEEKILKKRYYEVLKNVKKVDGINGDITKKTLTKKLEQLVIKCKHIEGPIKEKLEEICYKFVFDTFGVEYDELNVECVITDDIEIKQPLTPKSLNDSFFEDSEHIENINKEIMKRRFVNSLIQGASVRLSSNYEKILNKIYVLDQRLPELYFNITAINEYLSFVTERIPNEENIGGATYVDLSKDVPVIKSQGIIFPVLVFETIKAIMEFLSSHGLPEDLDSAEYIIGQADFLLAENWDKRLGVGVWDIISDLVKPENMNLISDVFVDIVSVKTSEFDKLMREILSNTKKSKAIIEDIVDDIKNSKKYNEINGALSDNNDLEDDYFKPEELIQNEDSLFETSTFSAGDYTYDAPAFLDDETSDHRNMISKSISDGL